MKNTKVLNFLRVLIFNIVETIVIFMIGLIFELNYNYIISLMIIFFMARMLCGQPKHYKKAYQCFIWSTLTFTSVYVLTDLHIFVTILLTVFTGFIATGRADIEEMYMWKGKNSNYIALIDLIAVSPNNKIILEHEEYWRNNYPMRYDIFKLYFRERNSYDAIREIKDLPDNKIIQKECKTIYDILERPLNLPPI
jgi:hypothetical protein